MLRRADYGNMDSPQQGRYAGGVCGEARLYKGWIGNLDEALYPELTWENSPKELTIKEE